MVSRAIGTSRCLFITGNNVILYGVKGRSVIKQIKHVSIAMDPRATDPCVDTRTMDRHAMDRHAMDSCSLFQISNAKNVSIRDLELNGNWGNAQTTISAASDGATLPQSAINVASTDGFQVPDPDHPAPTFELITPTGAQLISYTGMTPTSFTGCTGGSGTLRGDGDGGRIGYTVGRRSPANTHVTEPSVGRVLPQATIDVGSTTAFPPAGQLIIISSSGIQHVTYTGKTSNAFTGCSGGTGTLTEEERFVWSPDNGIHQCTQRDPHNHLVSCHAEGRDNVGIELLGVDFRQAYGDGLWIGGDGIGGGESGAAGGSRRVTVRDCTFDMCARNGISLIYSDGVVIDSCSFRNIITTAIDTEPETTQMRNVRIRDRSMRLDGGAGSTLDVRQAGPLPIDGTSKKDRVDCTRTRDQTLVLDSVTTTSDNCLVVQALGSFPGGGLVTWDEWTNQNLDSYQQIIQENNSTAGGTIAAAAGALLHAGPSGAGSVRAHGVSVEFGNGTYSFALRPPPSPPPPMWIANGAKGQGATEAVSAPWPAVTQEDDVGILLVLVSELDTGVTVSDPQQRWQELPGSPVLGSSNVGRRGVKLHLFGARASAPPMPAPTVSHGGPRILAEIMLFRGA